MNERLQYLVTLHDGHWKVLLDQYHGPYSDVQHAITNAIDAAHRAGKSGRDAEVLLSQEGKMSVIWTYGDTWPYAMASDTIAT